MQEGQLNKSKYVKTVREEKIFSWISIAFLFSALVMPQYFGLPTPVFDFTLLRMVIVVIVILILADGKRKKEFINLILYSKMTLLLIPYLLVITYTMVLRVDINAFLNPFIEILSLYIMIYIIQYVLGVEKTMKVLISFLYIFALLGIIEYAMGRSPFSYLETIKGVYTGQFVRSGNYRIMGPCNHSLGYGLLLIAVIPLCTYDSKEKQIDLLKRPILFFMLALNIFLTGSRSTLSVFAFEVIILFLVMSKKNKKKGIIIFLLCGVALGVFLIVGYNTGIAKYILLQFASIIDTVFGTEYSILFGGDVDALSSSSNYRDQLVYIFTVDWLNPLLGIGRKRGFQAEINGSFIKSVDNFYIAEYIRYAYPGLVTYVLFLLVYLVKMIKMSIKKTSPIYIVLMIGTLCYLVNLFWVDSLQTLKYLYILIALLICMERAEKVEDIKFLKTSKYIKDRKQKWM